MTNMKKTVLCFSRSYLSVLLPRLLAEDKDIEALHIVQTDEEERNIVALGQKVVLNLGKISREAARAEGSPMWQEPEDMRSLTGFDFSPIYADRYLPEFPQDVRLRIAGAIQAGLEEIFASHRIAGVLSEPVALFPTHYLLYLCKKNDARPLFWANTYFPRHFYFTHTINMVNPVRRVVPEELDADGPLITEIRTYLEKVASDEAGPVYHHKFSKGKQSGWSYFRQRKGMDALVLSPGLVSKGLQIARWGRAQLLKTLFPRTGDYISAASAAEHRFYLRNQFYSLSHYDAAPSAFHEGNIFFPLQYEPEASLLYAAPWARNQFAVIETILQSLPDGKLLWVKEHPNQFGPLSGPTWQGLRRRYSNLRLIFGRENGRHLIQRCSLAIAISSTAGLDALIFGRKCFVLGDTYYQDFPDAVRIGSTRHLATALNDMTNYVEENRRGDITALARALGKFARFTYPGDPQPSNELFVEENLGSLRRAIRSELAIED